MIAFLSGVSTALGLFMLAFCVGSGIALLLPLLRTLPPAEVCAGAGFFGMAFIMLGNLLWEDRDALNRQDPDQ